LAPHNCSTFQHPCYPHRDIEMTYANIVDVPLPAETTGAEFRVAVEVRWLSMLEQLRPQLIMIAAPDHLFLVVWSKNSSVLRYQYLIIYCLCHNAFVFCLT
jgi:hypothetical protein